MKAFFAAIALAVSSAYAQTFTVNTPILPGNQPGAAALVDFGTIESGTQHTWLVNLPANTLIGINLRDSTGTLVQSAPFPINAGTDTSCLNASSTTSSGSTTSRTTTSGSTTSSGTPSTTSATTAPTTSRTTTATTSGTTTTAPATTTSGGAAPLNTNSASKLSQVGFAGVAGAVVAALLA
ncbi:hypothetical protein MD484_g2969, partial [Candolleomyces efflorescens]